MSQMPIVDMPNSFLMGLDFVGTAIERGRDQPVTIGGCAQRRYLAYVWSLVPPDYRPDLHPDLRLKRYVHEEGIKGAPANVYTMLIATFAAWPLLPFTQAINVVRWAKRRLGSVRSNGPPGPHADDASEASDVSS
ncbi:MAG: hypothetical protein ABEK03_05180 [Candidatus Bipolaricaulia bacterium]